MAIKVHGNWFAIAPMRVFSCLNEKGLDYEFVPLDLRAESRAITRYIAQAYSDKGTPLISKDPKEMAFVFVWMEVETQRYDPPASKLTWELGIKSILGRSTDDAVVEEQEPELAKVLDVYEVRLAQSKYLGGDSISLADLHHLPTLCYLMGSRVKTVFNSRPHVSAWCAYILARPAFKKVVAMRNNQ
ncbi:hypothetical protein RD792_016997 [Penstemon davidsonii]|uniref:glutathione transferase n=1 Tax=Penstemon davidsonii TaxID=160366 RepID=A0ABR0CKS7_9LAMI|nr:hypothetical protein RD792_016997 [Penstemon davidsonii]